MNWSEIYNKEIEKKGGLTPFVLNKEKRSAGAFIKRVRKIFPQKSKILEIGTGTGAIGALLTKYEYVVNVIDKDVQMIDIAKKVFSIFGSPDKVQLMNAEDIVKVFGLKSFDLVFSHGMLEHYSDSDILAHIRNQLKISSTIVFIVPTEPMNGFYRSRGFGDERYLPTKYWKNLLKKAGYSFKVFGFGFKETHKPKIFENLIKIDMFARLLAPFCAYNEFWVTEKQIPF